MSEENGDSGAGGMQSVRATVYRVGVRWYRVGGGWWCSGGGGIYGDASGECSAWLDMDIPVPGHHRCIPDNLVTALFLCSSRTVPDFIIRAIAPPSTFGKPDAFSWVGETREDRSCLIGRRSLLRETSRSLATAPRTMTPTPSFLSAHALRLPPTALFYLAPSQSQSARRVPTFSRTGTPSAVSNSVSYSRNASGEVFWFWSTVDLVRVNRSESSHTSEWCWGAGGWCWQPSAHRYHSIGCSPNCHSQLPAETPHANDEGGISRRSTSALTSACRSLVRPIVT